MTQLQYKGSRRPIRRGIVLNDVFGMAETQIRPDSTFRCETRTSMFGLLEFTNISHGDDRAEQTFDDVSKHRKSLYFVILVRRGSISVKQGSKESVVKQGQLVLLDSDKPIGWRYEEPTEFVNVALPKFLLDSRLRKIPSCSEAYSSSFGAWKIACSFIDCINNQIDRIPELAAYRYSKHLVDMITLALEQGDENLPTFRSAVRLPLYRRCAAFISSSLSDDNLGPNNIARAMGISVRYLHRVFQESGESVSAFIRNARLDACKADLGDPSFHNKPIAAIAYRHGFRSQSYFATAFKKRFGLTSREWRRKSQGFDDLAPSPSGRELTG
jgi:AraC-like DNA-binding protein